MTSSLRHPYWSRMRVRVASVEAKLTAAIFLLIALVICAIGAYLTLREVGRLHRDLERNALVVARLTAHEVESAIAFDDRETAREVFDAMMIVPDVRGFRLRRSDGRLLFEAGTVQDVEGVRSASTEPTLEESFGVMRVTAPVVSKEGPRGTLIVELTLESLETERNALLRTTALIGIFSLLLGSVAAWRVARSISRRVERLARATAAIAAGDLSSPVPEDPSRDEIGQLALGYEHMVSSIRSLLRQLSDQAKKDNEQLEVLVRDRTKALDARNEAMRLVLAHVNQGFLTVDAHGVLSAERSAVLATWFGPARAGETFGSYMGRLDANTGVAFDDAWSQGADDVLPIELVVDQLPSTLRAGGRHFRLEYTLVGAPSLSDALLIVVSDVTAEVQRNKADEERRDLTCLFERALDDRGAVMEFFAEADALMIDLCSTTANAEHVRRAVHTLKGNADVMGLRTIARLCHALEDRMAETASRPSTEDLDDLSRAWSVLSSAGLALFGERTDRIAVDRRELCELLAKAEQGTRAEWTAQVARLALEPTSRRFDRIVDQVRVLGRRFGKEGLVVTVAANGIRLPEQRWAPFWSAFVHVVRNAVHHGIERPDARLACGKPASGTIALSSAETRDGITVEVTDDGGGIDWEAVRIRAVRAGQPAATASDLERALFLDGISTASEVSEISGRGVGLGAVRHACEALGGTVAVASIRGGGTTFTFSFPSASADESEAAPILVDPPRLRRVRPSTLPRASSELWPAQATATEGAR